MTGARTVSARRFVKEPGVVIEAIQWDGINYSDLREFIGESLDDQWSVGGYCFIHTPEGRMHASAGDWIIKGVQGEFYPCKPGIFDATYEPLPPAGRGSGSG
jgi:hypothetical protein